MDTTAFTRPHTASPLPLQNATQFAALVDRCLALARRERKPLTVLSLTVDHVGMLSEHAHLVAVAAPEHEQAVQSALGKRLRGGVRATDEVAQLGGHDLGVVLLAAGPAEGALVAARLHRVLTGPYRTHGLLLGARIRIGQAHFPQMGVTGRELVQAAGQALHVGAAQAQFAWAGAEPR